MRLSTFAAILTVTVCLLLGGTVAYTYATGNVIPSTSAVPFSTDKNAVSLTGEDRYALALWQHGIPASDVEKSTVALYGAVAGLVLGLVLTFPVHIITDSVVQSRRRRRYLRRVAC